MKCLCGCGQEVKSGNKFINRHYWKLYPPMKNPRICRKVTQNPIRNKKISERRQLIKILKKRRKIKIKMERLRLHNIGHKTTEHARRLISLKNTKEYNPEKCRKLSISQRGKTPWNKGLTKETHDGVRRISESKKFHNHPNWRGGKSYEPYGINFNKELKKKIRKRDGYRCQECFRHQSELRMKNNKPYKLNVHHIDYNKQNNKPNNLISLCNPCHQQTNFKRDDWVEYFQGRLAEN